MKNKLNIKNRFYKALKNISFSKNTEYSIYLI